MLVKFPASLWYTNMGSQIQSVQIDFNNGGGFQILNPGQEKYIQYSAAGVKTWIYKLTLSTGEILYSHSKINVETGISSRLYGSKTSHTGNGLGVDTLHITATESYLGKFGKATVLINYGNTVGQIRRPLILVEGLDMGAVTSPEELFGDSDLRNFENKVFLSESNNLNNLINGVTNINNDQQYDIIYVNWSNGTDYLQRNAYVLQEVIKWVNQEKATVGSTTPNVVLGQSMGGVIARYALKDMENKNLPHDTRTYISQDAPHLGANVPLGYQLAARHARSQYVQSPFQLLAGDVIVPLFNDGVGVSDYLEILDQPAVKQLLIERVDSNYGSDNTIHSQWQTELKNIGYPQLTERNVAIANGNQCAITQGFFPGNSLLSINGSAKTGWLTDLLSNVTGFGGFLNNAFFMATTIFTFEPGFLFGLLPGNSKLTAAIEVKALPAYGQTAQIYSGKLTFTKKLLWLIDINVNLTDRSFPSPPNTLPYDYFSGGVESTGIPSSTSSQSNVFYGIKTTIVSDPDFSFIPTVSALDIGKGFSSLTTADYLLRYEPSNPPLSPKDTPFDNFITSYQANPFFIQELQAGNTTISITNFNQQHLDLYRVNGDWLANEIQGINLNDNTVDCSFLCDSTNIVGSLTLCSSGTYSVNASGDSIINWSVSNSNAVSLSSTTGNTITLTTSGSTRTTITLTATISSAKCQANITENITIRVGAPGVPSYLIGPSTVLTGAVVDYQAGLSEGATSYEWRLPYPYTTVSIFNYSGQDWQLQAPGTSRYAKAFTGYAKTNGYVQVMGRNACGTGGAKLLYVTHGSGGGGSIASIDEPMDNVKEVTISPNPASNKVSVRLSKLTEYEGEPPSRILGIKVLDQNSRERKFYRYNEPITEVEINVAFLTRGLNFLIILTNQGSFTKKLLIE